MDVATHSPRTRRGITLIELIVTLAVASVSLAVVVPTWQGLSDRARITTTANGLLAMLHYARSTAVTRYRRVTLCPSSDGQYCSGNPTGWHEGYIVFIDDNANRSRDDGENLLRRMEPPPPGVHLQSTQGRPAISFRPSGAAWGSNTTFSVCAGERQQYFRAVILHGSGRARVDRHRPNQQPVDCA